MTSSPYTSFCPECEDPLRTDDLTPKLFWCINKDCKLFCRRLKGFFLMFESDSALSLIGVKE